MQDTRLYQQILGLAEPWRVERVELQVPEQEVHIWVEHDADARFSCPHCSKLAPLYDHAGERRWRHLDTCQFQTYLHARIPRVNCPEHGVSNVEVPWGSKNSRFTLMMERLVIDLLLACQNVQSVCNLIGLGWDAIAHVMERAVARGQKRKVSEPIQYLGVDEKSFRKGHHYITVVSDLGKGSVEYVAEDRRTESLAGYYRQLSESHKEGIKAVAMDMCQAYERATCDHLPGGQEKIVFDRFHIMQKLNQALDRVRQSENWELSRKQDQTLARTRQMWLWSQENLPAKYQEQFAMLKSQDLKTAKAWALKEHLRRLWDQPDVEAARSFFGHWKDWVIKTGLKPMLHVARTLEKKLEQT